MSVNVNVGVRMSAAGFEELMYDCDVSGWFSIREEISLDSMW